MTKPQNKHTKEEYYFLTNRLEEINNALEGFCNDVDCDEYLYRYCIKKKYKPVLNHKSSCIPSFKREKEALMRILSLSRYKKFRYEKCAVCGKKLDSVGNDFAVTGFIRPYKDHGSFEYKGIHIHKKCERKVIVPEGWEKI